MKDSHKNQSQSEWMQKILAASNPKPVEIKESQHNENNKKESQKSSEPEKRNNTSLQKKLTILFAVVIFFIAVIPRVIYLFFFTDPQNVGIDWYGDVYHHWQIAFLSKEIGFSHGFLRLWDLKGMEFYWGLLHPLLLSILFAITGSISVVIPRMVSIVFGSGCIVLIYLIVERYFNRVTAFGAALFAVFFPVTLFSETLGMQEPLGLFFLLLGIYILPMYPTLAGIPWFMAGMVRSEFWVIGFALMIIALLREKLSSDKKILFLLGYVIPSLLYMKYLLNWTGNPIYPIWVAYFAVYVGDWFLPSTLSPVQETIQLVSRIVLLLTVIIGGFYIWKKPKAYLFILLGLGNIAFFTLVHGFGARIRGWTPNTIVDRMLSYPYEFLGVVLAIILIYYLPKLLRLKQLKYFSFLIIIAVIFATQPIWFTIEGFHKVSMHPSWEHEMKIADFISKKYDTGTIIIPSGRPGLTYTLAYYHHVPGKYIMGEMYNPLTYITGDPFVEYGKTRKKVIAWLKKENIRYIVINDRPAETSKDPFLKLLFIEQGKLFEEIDHSDLHFMYRVKLDEG